MIRFTTYGNAKSPAAIFIHGFLGMPQDWEAIINTLEQDLFCIVISLPGHSGTPIFLNPDNGFADLLKALNRLLNTLEINSAIWIGYSLGGRIAIEFSKFSAHRVRHLFALSTHFGLQTQTARRDRLHHDLDLAKRIRNEPFDSFLNHWYTQPLFGTLSQTPAFSTHIQTRLQRHRPTDLALALRSLSLGHQLPFNWEESSFEIDYMIGLDDQKYTEYSHTLPQMPRLSIHSIPHSGHATLAQCPQAVASLIRSRMPF